MCDCEKQNEVQEFLEDLVDQARCQLSKLMRKNSTAKPVDACIVVHAGPDSHLRVPGILREVKV